MAKKKIDPVLYILQLDSKAYRARTLVKLSLISTPGTELKTEYNYLTIPGIE
jgi:hypothetical protein